MKQPKKVVEAFMVDTGYTNTIYSSGIRKDFKRSVNWDFRTPEEMLRDFVKWYRRNYNGN